MTNHSDLGVLWYGVPGVAYPTTDPADVLLNNPAAAPMLCDQPRSQIPQNGTNMPMQMNYEHSAPTYMPQPEYVYESYEGYNEDDSCEELMPDHEGVPLTDSLSIDNENDDDDDSSSPLPRSKKPKVHHNPALKLQTPIAYQKDTDLSAIPIAREGMAVCEKCGAIGVKHAFYGRERKYCSLTCARGPQYNLEKDFPHSDLMSTKNVKDEQEDSLETLEDTKPALKEHSEKLISSSPTPKVDPFRQPDIPGSFDWTSILKENNIGAVPVSSFKHAPMCECWHRMGAGMKVEVSSADGDVTRDAFWVATVIAVAGYKARLRFEGFVEDSSCDFWVDLGCEEVHPVGWCATQGRPLIPPKAIQSKYKDWKEFLMRRLTGARTLPTNFVARVSESQKSRFRCGLNVEVVDKNRIAQMRVATVTNVIGKRLHLMYHGASPEDNGFWCHEDAAIIHPVGWSREVGHDIVASQLYHEKCTIGRYDIEDAPASLFSLPPTPPFLASKVVFSEGMKLEAIDPLNLSTICVATVMKVLYNNYLMIRIDSYDSDHSGSDWFCYHATSANIFPAGFCQMNGILLTPPKGFDGQFVWSSYLKETKAQSAPSVLFNRDMPLHNFEVGLKLESADLMDPRLICVATVAEVKGRLLKVHFDGWENEFDQWVDSQSPDIYPVGWCRLVGYRLESPRMAVVAPTAQRRKKNGLFGGRKKTTNKVSLALSSTGRVPLLGLGGKRGRPAKGRESVPCATILTTVVNGQKLGPGGIVKRPRGRPRRPRMEESDPTVDLVTIDRPKRVTRGVTPVYAYTEGSDDDEDVNIASGDDTSSGVASLVGSEMSSQDLYEGDELECKPHSSFQVNSSFHQSVSIANEEEILSKFSSFFPEKKTSDSSAQISSTVNYDLVKREDDSYEEMEEEFIPRLADSRLHLLSGKVHPENWNVQCVSKFLRVNDCASYCDAFSSRSITGSQLLLLTQNEVMALTGMKVGPSLKIHDLIQQLMALVNPAKARYQANLMKRGIT